MKLPDLINEGYWAVANEEIRVEFDYNPAIAMQVLERTLEFFLNEEAFVGEQIYQSAIVADHSPEFLTELAKIINFKVTYAEQETKNV